MNRFETILIIDDEPQVRLNLRALLEDLGYRVEEASNGSEGLEACAAGRPDLVLLDLRMPGMDGLEVCARLEAEEATRAIPVVFLSGVVDAQEKVKAFMAGGADYVTKPFLFEEVELRVRTQLDIVRARRRLEAQNRALQHALRETETLNRKLIEMNERLRRSETLKGRFLSTMRNEINNPLNAILALGEELEQGAIPPERHRAIGGLIASEASDLDFGIRNVFSAADLEAGERYPHLARVDVPSVLRGVQDSLRYQARKKDIAITLETSGPGITEFRTDPEALRSIAANLVSNAIKFSPDGGPVHVRARADERSLALEVEDQGIGIRPEEQALVFERFKQLESGPARLHPGQGLGLAVVRALVDLLEGSITLSSQPKKGTFLTCTLPRRGTTNHGEDACPDGNLFFFGETEAL